jgi:hypothetical protein
LKPVDEKNQAGRDCALEIAKTKREDPHLCDFGHVAQPQRAFRDQAVRGDPLPDGRERVACEEMSGLKARVGDSFMAADRDHSAEYRCADILADHMGRAVT